MSFSRNRRWWIAIFLASITALNYLDRQNFPIAVTEISKHIPISDQLYSQLQMWFLLSYAIMYAGGGRIADWLGTRTSYTLMIVWWSAANLLHGLVTGVWGLGICRGMLGLGEGGGFPCSAKAVSEWFPPEERALAFGIFNTGSSVGAVIAPPLIALIIITSGWRGVFLITGGVGFLVALAWWLIYEPETSSAASVVGDPKQHVTQRPVSWIGLFRYREVWGFITAKFLTDSAWFFLIFWLPKYLSDVRHLNIRQIGYYAWIPYAFAGIGSSFGGWLSGFLIRRGQTLGASRKTCLAISAAIMPLLLLITASPLSIAMALFSLALFGHQFWATILQTLPADVFPSTKVGSVAGLMGAVGAFGAMMFNLFVGLLLTRTHSYSVAFLVSGLVYPVAYLLLLYLVPRIEPMFETMQPSASEIERPILSNG
jgi:MFS transporter, ACS family, hexuronate transporter